MRGCVGEEGTTGKGVGEIALVGGMREAAGGRATVVVVVVTTGDCDAGPRTKTHPPFTTPRRLERGNAPRGHTAGHNLRGRHILGQAPICVFWWRLAPVALVGVVAAAALVVAAVVAACHDRWGRSTVRGIGSPPPPTHTLPRRRLAARGCGLYQPLWWRAVASASAALSCRAAGQWGAPRTQT